MRLASLLLLLPILLKAQLTTGTVEGSVHDSQGRPASHFTVFILGRTGFQIAIQANSRGEFTISLPFGRYELSNSLPRKAGGLSLYVQPLQTSFLDLVVDSSGSFRKPPPAQTSSVRPAESFGIWSARTRDERFPQGFSLQSLVLAQQPGSVTVPLNFTGLADNRLALLSNRALSWTNTQFKLQGLDVTDSYQPGRPMVLPDLEAISEVVVRAGPALTASDSYGNEVSAFLPGAGTAWHVAISTSDTSSALASSNLPRARGLIEQPEHFNWFTRDRLEVGGPVTPWADLFAIIAGQWASQSIEQAAPGQDQNSRTLFGNVRGDIRAGPANRFDAEYSGSRLHLSDWGLPAGIEALISRRMSPEFQAPEGFADEAETDRFNFVDIGWTHQRSSGTLQVRYGYSAAQLHTWPGSQRTPNQSRIELLGSTVTGAPPLENLARRPRHEIASVWQPSTVDRGQFHHRIAIGGNWKSSTPQNQMTAPSDLNLITTNGLPAFVAEYNTPVNSIEKLRSGSAYAVDHLTLRTGLSLAVGALVDLSRGSLPAQSSPAGSFTTARN